MFYPWTIPLSFIHTPLQYGCVTDIAISIYCNTVQCTAPPFHFVAVLQCSSQYTDGYTDIAIYRNTDAVEYEQAFRSGAIPLRLAMMELPVFGESSPFCIHI